MRTARWFRGAMVAALALAAAAIPGCKGFWDPLPNTGGGGNGTNPASGVFYVLNQATNQLAGFSFAAQASSPTAVSGSPYALAAQPLSMAITSNGSYLYVSTLAGITVYTVNSDGSLTSAGQTLSGDLPTSMQVDPSGAWLLEGFPGVPGGNATLSAIPLDSSTGLVDTTRNEQAVRLPVNTFKQIAISPSGSSSPYVFVAMGAGGTAAVPFTPGNASPLGAVSRPITVKNSAGGDNTVAVDPQNRLLYVGETAALSGSQSGGLRVFTIGSSSVSEISGSPYSTGGTGPSSILALTSEVYVSNSSVSGSSNGNISGFVLDISGNNVYSLAAINTVSAGPKTYSLAEDNTSAYILAVNYGGSPDLSTFNFDSTTAGKLDAGPTASTGTDPVGAVAIVAVP